MLPDQAIQPLDKSTVRKLHSGQVIIDIESIVKELIENALDANAHSIDIKLVDNGLNLIQVKDDGHGIDENSRPLMGQRYHTSKITSMDDLEHLKTLGFRGEALNSICTLSETSQITTKTRNEALAKQYELDHFGKQISEKPVGSIPHTGTIISAHRPFFNIPVRRQMEQKTFSFKRIQDLLIKYSLVYPMVRFALTSVGSSRGIKKWIQPSTSGVMNAIVAAYGSQLSDMLEHHHVTAPNKQLSIECVLAKPNADPDIVYRGERVHVYINKRPVNYSKCDIKELVSLARKRFNHDTSSRKVPFICISIQIQEDQLDVNIEPSKMAVMLHHKQEVVDLFETLINRIYGSPMQRLFGAIQQEYQIDYRRLDDGSTALPSPNELDDNSGRQIISHQEHQEITYSYTTCESEDNANILRLESDQEEGEETLGMSSIMSTTPSNMDIDIPDNCERREGQQQTNLLCQANKAQNQLLPAFNDDGAITENDSNVWKFSMCSQETANSTSTGVDDDDDDDQLVPSDDGDDLVTSKEVPVSTLTEWLEKPHQQQQRPHVRESTSRSVSGTPLSRSLHDEQSYNRAAALSYSSPSPPTVPIRTTSEPYNVIATAPSMTSATTPTPQSSKQRSSASSSFSKAITQPFINSGIKSSSTHPSQQPENVLPPAIASSSSSDTRHLPVLPSVRQNINSPARERSVRSNRPDSLVSTAEESWQINSDYSDGQQEPTPMVIDSPQRRRRQQQQQQQQKEQAYVQSSNQKRTSPSLSPVSSDNRDLFEMFRMQSSTSLLVNPSSMTLSAPKHSAADKGKSVVRFPIDLQDHPVTTTPTPTPNPLILAQHQHHPPLPSVTNAATIVASASAAINMVPRKRKRNTLFSDQRKKSSALFNTLNLEMPIKIERSTLSTNYALQYKRLSRYHRTRLDQYQPAETIRSNSDIVTRQFPLLCQDMNRNSESLVVYTKEYHGANVKEIGILDLDRMEVAGSLNWFLKRYELVCKKQLKQPIHIELSQEDPYFNIIQSLESHESMLYDYDGQDRLYKVVTDRRIITNGFECRWRMLDCNTMLLQIVGVHDLDGKEDYGVIDFRELLSIIQQANECHVDNDDLSKYRPTRVIDYFGRLLMDPENLPFAQQKNIFSANDSDGDGGHSLDWIKVKENGETYTVGVSNLLEEQRSVVSCVLYHCA